MHCCRRKRLTLAILLLAILQFCLGLGRHDITTAFEGRVVATAHEMLRRHDYLVPYSNGVPRIVKPPLPYWAVMAAWTIAGKISVALARLPSAFLGALAVILMMDLARRTIGHRACLFAGLIWISTWFIVDEYRKAMVDPYLAFFTLLSLWLWVVAEQSAWRRKPRNHFTHLLFILCYVSAGLGAMAKGHLILLHLAIAIGSYQLLRRRRPGAPWAHVIGVFLLLLIAIPWWIYIGVHVPDAINEWRREALATHATAGLKTSPIYHYFINLPLTAAPWTVFALIGAIMAIVAQRKRDRLALWPLAWLAATVLVFTCVPMKKNAYLLPAMPAQTMLAAFAVASATRRRPPSQRARSDDWLIAGHYVAAIMGLIVVLFFAFRHEPFSPGLIATSVAGITVGIVALGLPGYFKRTSPRLLIFYSTAFLFMLAVHVVEAHLIPDSDNERSDAPFARNVNRIVGNQPLDLVGGGLREDVLFYLDRTTPRFDTLDQLPPDFRGYVLVTDEQIDAADRWPRAQKLLESAPRPEKDKLVLFRITPSRTTTR